LSSIVIIVQARMSSSRLPGKTLKILVGKPLLEHICDRLKRVNGYDRLVIATSTDPSDDPIALFAIDRTIEVFRGELTNVQKRFFAAATASGADVVVRVTGDNPLIAPELIDEMIQRWEKEGVDYIGYHKAILGIGAELFTMKSFAAAIALMDSAYAREHVTPPYYQMKDTFKTLFLDAPPEYVDETLRLTVDTEKDFKFVESLIKKHMHDGFVHIPDVVHAHRLIEKGKK